MGLPRVVALAAVLSLGAGVAFALAVPTVYLEIFIDDRTPLTAPQEWIARLGQVGVSGVQIRSKQPDDKVAVERVGTPSQPVYRVTGSLNSSGELVLPGARFRAPEAARVAEWVKQLARLGPPSERPARLPFGLLPNKLEQVRADLRRPVGFLTAGMTRAAVVQRIASQLEIALEAPKAAMQALESDKTEEELCGLSSGTALACVLRPAGLCLVPKESEVGNLRYEVVSAAPNLEIWPVGWPPEKLERDVVPEMYEFRNVNVQDVPVCKVVEAVCARLKVPALWDHNALARHGVEPDKAIVSVPKSRTTYGILLRKALFQARLKYEVRVDEAGKAFLWVTTLKPL